MQLSLEIHTPRLLLRPPGESDIPRIHARYATDPEVCRYLSWFPHRHVDETADWVRKTLAEIEAGALESRLIFERESGELIGAVGGGYQEHRLQFGYCLARDSWGFGYATEAAGAFVAAIMTLPTIWRVQAFCDVDNVASARVLEKIGLSLEGTLRRYMVLPNMGSTPRDMLCYAIVRDEKRVDGC